MLKTVRIEIDRMARFCKVILAFLDVLYGSALEITCKIDSKRQRTHNLIAKASKKLKFPRTQVAKVCK